MTSEQKKGDKFMNEDINEQNTENVSEQPSQNTVRDEQIRTEAPHTSVPSGSENGGFYGQNGGSYYHYSYTGANRQTTTVNPYAQNNYNYGYGYNSGYGYQQPQTQPAQQSKKSSGGKIAAIIAVSVAALLIVSLAAFVGGMMFTRGAFTPDVEVTGESSVTADTPSTVPDTAEETQKSPATDPGATVQTGLSEDQLTMTEAAKRTVNSVVEIRTEQTVSGTFMQQYIQEGAGSGVIVTKDGYIATNNHVIEGATNIKVILRDGTEYKAELVGTDAQADLAVVKIDATDLSPAKFGDSDKLVVAQTVIAIGNPLGELGGSVTNGIISALTRNVTIENQEMTLMQTTAAVNPGNSGGGLFNMSGECIGIVNAKSSGSGIEGIGFAIPSNTAVKVIEDLMQYGYVRGRVMLGISMLEVFDRYTANRYGVKEYGVYVSSVGDNSDAAKAGIKSGDRLLTINGTEVDSYATAKKLIQACSVGDTAKVSVDRNGTTLDLTVKFTEYIPS